MRIAFYAPMKPPGHPLPSGDRSVARALLAALRLSGHSVMLASTLRSWEGDGCAHRQARLRSTGDRCAARLLRRWCTAPEEKRPQLWFTYHLYHKAPDLLGPFLSHAFGIPYVVAEASHAGKQAAGRWAAGHAAAAAAIAGADLVFGLNPADDEGVRDLLAEPARLVRLLPFVDARPWALARARGSVLRLRLRAAHRLPADEPLLIAAAMLRPGDKLASFRLLGRSLAMLRGWRWRLLVAGDGPARRDVARALAAVGDRVTWLGRVAQEAMPEVLACADLCVWPAVGEAWGMALLEAQAAGVPVVAGRTGGVPAVIADGQTGRLTRPGDAAAFAAAIADLLDARARRERMGIAAIAHVRAHHDLPAAARRIDRALQALFVRAGGEPCPAG
jgi:glycosyltransferase involved in cell wall biosynthesis